MARARMATARVLNFAALVRLLAERERLPGEPEGTEYLQAEAEEALMKLAIVLAPLEKAWVDRERDRMAGCDSTAPL